MITNDSGPRIITPDSYNEDRKVPAALNLPEGKFFFGYTYVPFDPEKVVKKEIDAVPAEPFGGQGTSLRSQARTGSTVAPPESDKPAAVDPWAKLGGGNTLSAKSVKKEKTEEEKAKAKQQQEIIDATMLEEEEFWDDEVMDDDDEDDDDIIEIDRFD